MFTTFRHIVKSLVAPLVIVLGVTLSGCSPSAEPTRLGIEVASATTQPKPSVTTTPKPSSTPSSTIEPTVKPSATPTQPPPTQEPVYYYVESGDYAQSIAESFGITVDELVTANGITEDDVLSIGQKLLIPIRPQPTSAPENTRQAEIPTSTPGVIYVSVTHVVQKGETIDTIAAQYGITWEEIAEANGIGKDSILSIGQELTIPNVATSPETTTKSSTPGSGTSEPTLTVEPETQLPATVIYIVTRGDYLELIADRFEISVDELAKANGISSDAILQVGQELVIPNQMATVAPTLTPTATLTPTPTPVKRVIPTSRPTAADVKPFPYQQPILLAPVNKSAFQKADAPILLNWISVGILTDSEWYQVRIWKNETQGAPLLFYTKATSWRPPVGFYNSDNIPYTIRWQVVVVSSVQADSTFAIESPFSAVYSFYWR
ncbi:MAG: muramidase family protein [Anaerolineae bacterium]